MTGKQWCLWAITPSGDHEPPYALSTWLLEAPLPAHVIGGLAVFGAYLCWAVLPLPWKVWWAGTLVMGFWQAERIEALGTSEYPIPQAIVRILIGSGVLALLVLAWMLR